MLLTTMMTDLERTRILSVPGRTCPAPTCSQRRGEACATKQVEPFLLQWELVQPLGRNEPPSDRDAFGVECGRICGG